MESWNSVINSALLGTEKRSLNSEDVDPAFAESFALIQEHSGTKEDAFLQSAALVYNYRQCGFKPLRKETISITQAENEEKSYALTLVHSVLSDVLESGSLSLFRFWLEQCERNNRIVQPEMVPLLLNASVKSKELERLINACCGRRGEWLRQFNPEWKKEEINTDEERWQTGTLAQRKAVLSEMRKQAPASGRERLQQTWGQESAVTRAELLESLLINAGEEDLQWLAEVQNEKSVKVKEAALQVLKIIPGSAIVQSYWSILQQSVLLNTSKGILGIGSKTSLELALVPVDPAIFKTGIQQLSSKANTADDEFILYQLIAAVPPRFWEAHFGMERDKILALFQKDNKGKAMIPAFGQAASLFNDVEWLRAIIKADTENLHEEAFVLLTQKEAETYAIRFLTDVTTAGRVLQHIDCFSEEWSLLFAKAVLRFTAKNAYQYHRGFYNDRAALLPLTITGELEKLAPKEEYLRSMWSNVSDHITKLVTLKEQTMKAFQQQNLVIQ